MGQRHQARTPAPPAPMLALLERVWWGCAPKPGAVGGERQLHGHLLLPLPDVPSSAKHCWEGQTGERRAWRVVAGVQAEGPALLQALMTVTTPPLLLSGPLGHMSLPKVWRSSAASWGAHVPATVTLTASLPIQVLRRGDPSESGDLSANADGEGRRAHQGGPAWAPNVSEAALSPARLCVLPISHPREACPRLPPSIDGWMG